MFAMKWRQLLSDCTSNEMAWPELWEEMSTPKTKTPWKRDLLSQNKNFSTLIQAYRENRLITTRLGNVESTFLAAVAFAAPWHVCSGNSDERMQTNAGLYFKSDEDRRAVHLWWTSHTIEMIRNSYLTSCISFLWTDLFLWSLVGVQERHYYDWADLYKIILRYSDGKKVLYVGQATESMAAGFQNLVNVWNFQVSNFSLSTVYVPQTTRGMPMPSGSMIEEANKIVDHIDRNHSDFDTAVFGCGAWGPPLMNLLRLRYGKTKNLMYIGSDTYRLFGVRTRGVNLDRDKDANATNQIYAKERAHSAILHIDGGKYWA